MTVIPFRLVDTETGEIITASERTCRRCDGTGNVEGFATCEACGGTGNAAPGDVPRPAGLDERRRIAPTDHQVRTLHALVERLDPTHPAVMLASDALGRSDADRFVINAHIATLANLEADGSHWGRKLEALDRIVARRGEAALVAIRERLTDQDLTCFLPELERRAAERARHPHLTRWRRWLTRVA